MKKMHYLKSVLSFLLILAMLLLVSCNNAKTSSNDNGESGKTKVTDANVANLPPLSDKVTNKTVTYLTHTKPDITGETDATSEFIKQYGITVEYITVPGSSLQDRLIQMVAANSSPDLINGTYTSPAFTLIKNNLIQPVDGMIDFNEAVWDTVRTPISNAKVGGKIYRVIQHISYSNMVWYNTKMFKEMGLQDPGYYYDRGEWDTTRLFDLATKLTVDKNNDGTPDQWGFGGHNIPDMLIGATGEGFLMYDANGNFVNNMRSAKIAKAMGIMQDMWFKYSFRPSGDNNEFQAIMNNKLAMGYFGHWNAVTVEGAADRIAAGDLSWVPAPTLPGEQRFYHGTAEDRYIAVGAKNPEGAAAVLVYQQYLENQTREKKKKGETKEAASPEMVKRSLDIEQYINSSPAFTDLPGTAQWSEEIYKRVWAMVPWSTAVEEFSPMLDAAIANVNKQ